MKLFKEDGCITDEGLHALLADELDEMGRLELAEHLDFCDACVERYSMLLTEAVEISPPTLLSVTVMRRIRSRARSLFLNRFTRVSVAAVLALVIWVGGFYQNGILLPSDQFLENLSEKTTSFTRQIQGLGDGMSEILRGLGAFFTTPRTTK